MSPPMLTYSLVRLTDIPTVINIILFLVSVILISCSADDTTESIYEIVVTETNKIQAQMVKMIENIMGFQNM